MIDTLFDFNLFRRENKTLISESANEAVGSSKITTFACIEDAFAISSILCSARDKELTFDVGLIENPRDSKRIFAFLFSLFDCNIILFLSSRPIEIFSPTVKFGKI